MKKCPVDISIVRPSESAEKNTFDFSTTITTKTRIKTRRNISTTRQRFLK